MPAAYRRVNLNLTMRSDDALGELVQRTGLNQTEVMNRALQLYQFWVQRETEGASWHIREGDEFARIEMF